jgi:PIN domain
LFKILIDTCVWLDLAKDYQQQPILAALEELIRLEEVELILPRTILKEFARNRAPIIEESQRAAFLAR